MVQTVFIIQQNKIKGVQKIKEPKKKVKIIYKQKKCRYTGCNNLFTPRAPHQLYCSDECRYYSDMDHTLERVRKFRKKYGNVLRELPGYVGMSLGTGKLGEHRCDSMEEEERKIRQEIRALGLTSVVSY